MCDINVILWYHEICYLGEDIYPCLNDLMIQELSVLNLFLSTCKVYGIPVLDLL